MVSLTAVAMVVNLVDLKVVQMELLLVALMVAKKAPQLVDKMAGH